MAVIPLFAALFLPASVSGQTVARTGIALPAVSGASLPGRTAGGAASPSPVVLSLSAITPSLLAAPGAGLEDAAFEVSPSIPDPVGPVSAEVPVLAGEEAGRADAIPSAVSKEGLSKTASEDAALPVASALVGTLGLENEAGVDASAPVAGEAASKLSAAKGSLSGIDSQATAEGAKSLSGVTFGESRGTGSGVSAVSARQGSSRKTMLERLMPWRAAAGRAQVSVPQAGASGSAKQEPPSRLTDLRNLARGAFYGLALVVSPIATAFALDPVDGALGLHPFPLLRHLTVAFPSFGPPFALFWTVFTMFIPVLGFFAIKKGIASLTPGRPGRGLAVAGAGLLATALSALLLQSLPAMVALSMLSTIVLATGEEVMFRAGMLPWLRKRFEARGWRWAVPAALILSSAVFSLVHLPVHSFTLNLFVLKFVLGIVLGLLYLRTGNLAAPAAAHSAYNILVSVLSPLVGLLAGLPVAGVVSIAVLSAVLVGLRSGWFPRSLSAPGSKGPAQA